MPIYRIKSLSWFSECISLIRLSTIFLHLFSYFWPFIFSFCSYSLLLFIACLLAIDSYWFFMFWILTLYVSIMNNFSNLSFIWAFLYCLVLNFYKFSLSFFLNFFLFIYFWLCWLCCTGFFLLLASGNCFLIVVHGLLIAVAPLVAKNSMDKGAWCATVYGVAKSWTQLSN